MIILLIRRYNKAENCDLIQLQFSVDTFFVVQRLALNFTKTIAFHSWPVNRLYHCENNYEAAGKPCKRFFMKLKQEVYFRKTTSTV